MHNSTSSYALPTVVIADPDPASQRQLTALLQQEFRCLTTSTLRETHQVILREVPALLILELDQPDGDGVALIQHLHESLPLRGILIACVSQRASLMEKVRAFRAGADDYLVKPVPATFVGQMLLLRRTGHLARAAAAY